MTEDFDRSLGAEQTVGAAKRRPTSDVSLGDERTLGDSRSGQDTVIDDIEVVDLEARYRIERTLGQGGMGAVLLATDTRLDRKVAIKRILGEAAGNRMAVNRFLTEAKSIAALNHPNIVQIYDYGRAKDGPFLIMEYVDGGSLLDRCRESALPLDEAIDLACQLCDGLAKAHDLGIVHRDIKPANVLLTRDGIPKLTDFGLAKAQAGDHGQTMTGAVLGTPDFMPPEQRRDASLVDHRSDLWSLAATVYQMVTGRSPKIIRFDLLPVELTKVLGKALEDAKESRYQSARELRDAIKTSLLATASVQELAEGACPSCGVKNESTRRFCRGCGESLEAQCLSCSKPMPMWEDICGQCGTRQTPLIEERRQEMAKRQAEAEGLLGDHEFDQAATVARSLRAELHPKLKHLTGWTDRFLQHVEKSREDQTRQAVETITEAAKHEAACDFLSAIFALESIPQSLRGSILPGVRESATTALERLKGRQKEVGRLESLVRKRLAEKSLDDLLPDVMQLLELQPDRDDIRKLKVQLLERQEKQAAARARGLRDATLRLEVHDYDGAVAVLSAFKGAARSAEIDTLQEKATRLLVRTQELAKKIKDGVAAKKLHGLLGIVDEYLQIKPADESVSKLRDSLVAWEEKLSQEITAKFDRACALEAGCRFDEAVKFLEGIPVSRRPHAMNELIARCGDLGLARREALAALSGAGVRDYGKVVESTSHYRASLTERGLEDEELTALLTEAAVAHTKQSRKRKIRLIVGLAGAGVAAAVLLVLGTLVLRSTMRANALQEAVAQKRWDDVLAIDPMNVEAYAGRARIKLVATPPDTEGAFADLEHAAQIKPMLPAVKTARADAFAVRAKVRASADQLSDAVSDLAEAKRGSAADKLIREASAAIAEGWALRADRASRKRDGVELLSASESARRAGVAQERLLPAWLGYATLCAEALDPKGLGMACLEGNKLGLSSDQIMTLWIRYGEIVAAQPYGDPTAVKNAIEAAKAAGATEQSLATLSARGLLLEASAMIRDGHSQDAVAKLLESSSADPAAATAALNDPANAALKRAVVADYRIKFDAAIASKDWDSALRVAAAATGFDSEASKWIGTAIVEHPDGLSGMTGEVLSRVPGEVLSRLPQELVLAMPMDTITRLPAATLAALPPAAIINLSPLQNSVGIALKMIPAGRFTMGEAGGNPDETSHEVTLTQPFYMGIHEVTNGQWERVMGRVPSEWKNAENPVETVSWEDAVDFCRKLSALAEERKAGRVYRLPTEAEWEYACRAGTKTTYSFGDDESVLDTYAWFDGNSKSQTHPVGNKKSNSWGLFDMHGNVWEWCSDWYGDYGNAAASDPQGPSKGYARVNRGGSWGFTTGGGRSSLRGKSDPSSRFSFLGFRVAMRLPDVKVPTVSDAVVPGKGHEEAQGDANTRKRVVYLVDLIARNVHVQGELGRGGELMVRSKPCAKALGMHPFAGKPAIAEFDVPEGCTLFEATAAVDDKAKNKQGTPLTFTVLADGRELWESQPIVAGVRVEKCRVDVGKVKTITLLVDCPGPNHYAWAAWCDAQFLEK